MPNIALHLWCLSFGLVSCDHLLSFEFFGFTIKIFYFSFLASFLCISSYLVSKHKISGLILRLYQFFTKTPFLFAGILIGLQFFLSGFSVVSYKSYAYSLWLLFDVGIVASSIYLIAQTLPKDAICEMGLGYLKGSAFLLSMITIIDFIAYFYGYKNGLIGYNQDKDLHWGLSRPHAFSYEPSYLGMFLGLCFIQILSFAMEKKRGWTNWITLSLVISVFLLLFSRSAIVSLLLTASVLFFFYRKKIAGSSLLKIILGFIFVVTTAYYMFPERQKILLRDRLITTLVQRNDGSGLSRIRSMATGWEIGRQSHLIGVGPGASFAYYIKYVDVGVEKFSLGAEVIMSVWAETFAETGLIGLILTLCFAIALIFRLWAAKIKDGFVLGALSNSLVFFLVSCHFFGNIPRTDLWAWSAFWFVCSLGSSFSNQSETV